MAEHSSQLRSIEHKFENHKRNIIEQIRAVVTENKNINNQQLGLNGSSKAQTCYWRVIHHAGSNECRSTHAEGMSDQNNETCHCCVNTTQVAMNVDQLTLKG